MNDHSSEPSKPTPWESLRSEFIQGTIDGGDTVGLYGLAGTLVAGLVWYGGAQLDVRAAQVVGSCFFAASLTLTLLSFYFSFANVRHIRYQHVESSPSAKGFGRLIGRWASILLGLAAAGVVFVSHR